MNEWTLALQILRNITAIKKFGFYINQEGMREHPGSNSLIILEDLERELESQCEKAIAETGIIVKLQVSKQ